VAVFGTDHIAVPSAPMVRAARELGIAVERVPFGVALDRWPVAPPRRREAGRPANLLQVADISPVKDQETLLMTAVHLRERKIPFVLEIIGADTLGGAMQRRATELGLDACVRFAGFLPQEALKERM